MKQKRILVAFAIGALVIAGGVARAALIAPSTPQSASTAATDATAQPALDLPTDQTAGGQDEGIAVHGAWTIKVMSPDGELVSTTSFENTYNSTSFLPDVLARSGGVWVLAKSMSAEPYDPCLINGSSSPIA